MKLISRNANSLLSDLTSTILNFPKIASIFALSRHGFLRPGEWKMDIYSSHSTWLLGIRSVADLDDFCRRIWKLNGQGILDDDDAQALAEKAEAHRTNLKKARSDGLAPPRSFFPVKPKSDFNRTEAATGRRDPKRWARKRRLGDGSVLLPEFRGLFTEGERAALYIVISDWRTRGRCDCTVEEIGDRAGVGPTTVRSSLRKAAQLKILQVIERRQWRARNLPNVIKVIHEGQREWVKKFRPNLGLKKYGIGFNKATASETYGIKNRNGRPSYSSKPAPKGGFQPSASRGSGFG